ncbi:MAG: hypothetical protein ABII82_18885 [Verrucomicrobiota bacterium]
MTRKEPTAKPTSNIRRYPTRDWLTFGGACDLAAQIQAAWHADGHAQVKTRVEAIADKERGGGLYCVRSNLVNGLPPRA